MADQLKSASSTNAVAKTKKKKPSHPPIAYMVNTSISTLNEQGGSSLNAIKKYITVNYKVNAEKLAPFIKKYLKTAVGSGALIQSRGNGASGSFKVPSIPPVSSFKPKRSKSADEAKEKTAGVEKVTKTQVSYPD